MPENHNCCRFYFLGIPDWFHFEIYRLLYVNRNLSRTLATYFWLEYVWIEPPLKRHFLTHNTVALFIITSLHQHFPFALCKHIMKLLYRKNVRKLGLQAASITSCAQLDQTYFLNSHFYNFMTYIPMFLSVIAPERF